MHERKEREKKERKNMSRFCRNCDKLKEGCSKCGTKDLYYCHTCSKKNIKMLKGKFYCQDCLGGNICLCGEDITYKCPLCYMDTSQCTTCNQSNRVLQTDNTSILLCKKCFNKYLCLVCERHIVTYKCYMCAMNICNPCRTETVIDVSPITLYPNQMVFAIARYVKVCATCMQNHTVTDIQDIYRNVDGQDDLVGNNNNDDDNILHPEE